MSKRVAGIQLTADNADEIDEEREEAGEFQVASEVELKKRVIKTARRGRTVEGQSTGSANIFAKLKSLSASMARPTRSESTTSSIEPASFSAGCMYTFSSTSSATPSTAASSVVSMVSDNSLARSLSKNSKYMEKLGELNCSVSAWISQNVKGNPYVDLTPIFNDYKAYWKSIEGMYDNSSSSTTTDSGVLVNDSDTNSSSTAQGSSVVSEGSGNGSEVSVCPMCGAGRPAAEESMRSVPGESLPTVTLSLKGTGNWKLRVPNQISQLAGSTCRSDAPPISDQSGTESLQPATVPSNTDYGSGLQTAPSTLDSSSYTTLKIAAMGGRPPDDQPPGATAILQKGSQHSGSIANEAQCESKIAEEAPPVPARSQRGYLLAHTGPSGSTKDNLLNNKLPGSPLNPLSSAGTTQPVGSFSGTVKGQLTGNSFVGSTLPADQTSSGVFPTVQTTSSQQRSPVTPALSSTLRDDSQEEIESTRVTEVDDDSLYSSRARLFYKKGEEFVELGVGTLKVEAFPGKMARLLLRNDSSLRTVILNISVTSQIPLTLTKNNLLVMCPEPNPPLDIEVRPVGYLIRVKTPADAQRLMDAIKTQTEQS